MSALRKLLGVLIIIGAIMAGVWFDLWVMLIGGIVEFVNGVKATPTNGHEVLWGVLRAVVFNGVGTIAAIVLVIFGLVLIGYKRKPRLVRRFRRHTPAPNARP